MARIARLVVPGIPHHVTQRGNRRETTFFKEAGYRLYLGLLGKAAARAGAEVWAYCLMPNHVHAIVTPKDEHGLRRTFGDLHRRYTGHINARHRWTGHLWQARFGSVAMDEDHLIAAVRYVALNPVRARLVRRPEDWPWSSVRAHLDGRDDRAVMVAPVLERVGDFSAFLGQPFDELSGYAPLRVSGTTGRPIGSDDWIRRLEKALVRPLAPRKRGPKPQQETRRPPPIYLVKCHRNTVIPGLGLRLRFNPAGPYRSHALRQSCRSLRETPSLRTSGNTASPALSRLIAASLKAVGKVLHVILSVIGHPLG